MKKFLGLTMSSIIFGSLVLGVEEASAASTPIYAPEEKSEYISEVQNDPQIPAEDKPALVEKINNDILFDADNPLILDGLTEDQLTASIDQPLHYVFEDGSYLDLNIDEELDVYPIAPKVASKAPQYIGVTAKTRKLKIRGKDFWTRSSMRTSVTIRNTPSASNINYWTEPYVYTFAGSASAPEKKLVYAYENMSEARSAYAWMSFTRTAYPGFSSRTYYLRLYVGKKNGEDQIRATYTKGSTSW
ncbi:hypothetical protein P4361_18810 [Fictibacillus sp. B-59209]|uniref:hypothetical protein n=1 Tax=Fictibacillus sp. B-59209 TaxID=3024873 RepID=UPI002E1C4A07|nr:hypothetical protein [Fictibacillus sp. B-59209]